MTCEKCWSDAYDFGSGQSRYERYLKLLKERKSDPCSLEEQAGQWWDEKTQKDRRNNHG